MIKPNVCLERRSICPETAVPVPILPTRYKCNIHPHPNQIKQTTRNIARKVENPRPRRCPLNIHRQRAPCPPPSSSSRAPLSSWPDPTPPGPKLGGSCSLQRRAYTRVWVGGGCNISARSSVRDESDVRGDVREFCRSTRSVIRSHVVPLEMDSCNCSRKTFSSSLPCQPRTHISQSSSSNTIARERERESRADPLVLLDTLLLHLIVPLVEPIDALLGLQDDLFLFPLGLFVPLLDLCRLGLSPLSDRGGVGLGELGRGERGRREDGAVVGSRGGRTGGGVWLRRIRSGPVRDGLPDPFHFKPDQPRFHS